MTATSRGTVLLLARSQAIVGPTRVILGASGLHVEQVPTLAEAIAWLRMHRAAVCILDQDATDHPEEGVAGLVGRLREGAGDGLPPLLALVRPRGDENLRALFAEARLLNFLALGEDEQLDPIELGVTVAKILSGDIFGIDRYLGETARRCEFRVLASSDKARVVDAAEAFALEAGCHPQIAQSVATAIDELFTNALYNAPTDAAGRPRFAHLPRSTPVTLDPGEEILVRMATDGRRLLLGAVDPFGSLVPGRIVDYLAKCLAKGADQVDAKQGGAGLGLYYLFSLTHHFVVNIHPGVCTEAIGLIRVSKSYKAYAARGRSFNVFVAGA